MPRRYAYALTKQVRAALERSVWPDGKPTLSDGAPESVSPVIHGLATHDVFGAFLRAGDPEAGIGLAAWVPERPCIRLVRGGYLRPDALAVARAGDASILLVVERDLGTERGPVLAAKLERYRRIYDYLQGRAPLHVGFVVDSGRRAASVRARLRGAWGGAAPGGTIVSAWVVAEPALGADPYSAVWTAPDGTPGRVPGTSRRNSRDRVATPARQRARYQLGSCRARAAEVRRPYGVPESAPAPGRRRRPARPSAPGGAGMRLAIVRPDPTTVAGGIQVRDNAAMDPVVTALAQLVRDRWANERRASADRRRHVRAVGGEPK